MRERIGLVLAWLVLGTIVLGAPYLAWWAWEANDVRNDGCGLW
jgi:hypothetical protein